MALERFKDVTINGRDFRLGLVPAHIGSWVLVQVMTGKSTELDVYQKIQSFLFAECSLLVHKDEAVIPMKIFADGRFINVDLQYDTDTAMDLYKESFSFNFDPFFEKLNNKIPETDQTTT
jgi:hypothetical protein